MKFLEETDPCLASIISHEYHRAAQEINLIASENYAPYSVMQATGSVLTNKYAEGYPGHRYYGGCAHVDEAETLAIKRCKELFGAEHANVQPHSGSQANMAAYFALLNPGDTILGMNLAAGGHLTHGHPVNFSGKFYNTIQYSVNKETECLDYDEIEKLAQKHTPKLIIAGASAYSRIIDFERFAVIAKKTGAYLMVDMAHIAGLVAAGIHPSPIPYADVITSTTHKTLRGPRGGIILCKQALAKAIDRAVMPGIQGGPFMNTIAAKAVCFHLAMQKQFQQDQKQTIANAQALTQALAHKGYRMVSGTTDNHLCIVDVRSAHVTGFEAEQALAQAGISVSRSCIPFDPEKPWITSGIRIGTPSLTSRGMQEPQMEEIATLIDNAITHPTQTDVLKTIREKAAHLCQQFPLERALNQ